MTTSKDNKSLEEDKPEKDKNECDYRVDAVIYYLVKNEDWRNLQKLLRQDYYIHSVADQITLCALLQKLIKLSQFQPGHHISISEFTNVFNHTFEGAKFVDQDLELFFKELSPSNELDEKYDKIGIDFNQLLCHEQLPAILLQMNNRLKDLKSKKHEKREWTDIFCQFIPATADNIDVMRVRIVEKNDEEHTEQIIYKTLQYNKDAKSVTWKYDDDKLPKLNTTDFNQLLIEGKIECEYDNNAVIKKTIYPRSDAWLSCELRLDAIGNKEQSFTISGWISVIWREPKHSLLCKTIMDCYRSEANSNNVWFYGNKLCMRILDLRNADKICYCLPIDATKIFERTSIKEINHIEPPSMIFDKKTRIIKTNYCVQATLSEHYELFWFPFDKQFLNIKLRWNIEWYHILHWENGIDQNGIPKILKINKNDYRYKQQHYDEPLKVRIVEELQDDIVLHEPWVGINRSELEQRERLLRFALIRLRFTRNPEFFALELLFPLFIIVLCGFSVYAIDVEDIADRLGVSITVLLTFTAFQSMRSDMLPNTAELMFLDYYILYAYLIQVCGIFGVCYPYFNADADSDDDDIFAKCLFILWIIPSVLYIGGGIFIWFGYKLMKYLDRDRKGVDAEFGLCDNYFWKKRSRQELTQWQKQKTTSSTFHMTFSHKNDSQSNDAEKKNNTDLSENSEKITLLESFDQ